VNAVLETRTAGTPPAGELAEMGELWAWTIPVALLGSWTCFAKVPGLNWALWTAAAAAGYARLGRRSGKLRAGRYGHAALALACLLSGAAAVTASPHSDVLIFLSVAALGTFAVLAQTSNAAELGPFALARAPLTVCSPVLAEAAARIEQTFAVIRMPGAVPLVRGGTLAMALALALFLLLSAADPTLADWREAAWGAVLSLTFLARDVFFVVLATLLLGAYGLAARPPLPRSREAPQSSTGRAAPRSAIQFSGLERLMVLGAAGGLFVLFFAVELASRFAAHGPHLAPGETFAEATHRGFGEMIVAAALCAIVIIALDRHALRDGRERWVRWIGWGVVAASLLVVVSAYQRVRFYEAAYGYTEQRLYVQVCCGAVSLALLLLAVELRAAIEIPRLTRRVALVALACVGGLSYWNSAGWIVEANVARYERTGKLDATYLAQLARFSPDAVPRLLRALPRLAPADAERVRDALAHAELVRSMLVRPENPRELSWYESSLRRSAANSALRGAGLLAPTP
jgi:hypothetical protein